MLDQIQNEEACPAIEAVSDFQPDFMGKLA
jgi:hypothetical protein